MIKTASKKRDDDDDDNDDDDDDDDLDLVSESERVFVLIHEQIECNYYLKKKYKGMMLHTSCTKASIKIDHMYLIYCCSQKLFILKPKEVKKS